MVVESLIEKLFDVANFIALVGTGLLIRAVVKDKDTLKGYSLPGSFLTFLAVLIFQIGFFLEGYYISIAFSLVTMLYWLLVVLYLINDKLNKSKASRIIEIRMGARGKAGAKR